jgi:hypothetical protein
MRHWPQYHIDIFEQVRDWLIEDGLPEDEASQHAHRMVSTIPDVFKVAIEPGAVINTMHLDHIGDGTVTVHEGEEAHTTYALWQYVDTSQGKKFFGLAHMPNTSTGHVLVMRQIGKMPPEPTPAEHPPGSTHL